MLTDYIIKRARQKSTATGILGLLVVGAQFAMTGHFDINGAVAGLTSLGLVHIDA